MRVGLPKLLTRKEAAEVLGVKPETLAVWHCTGRYKLPVVKVGRSCRYRLADLEKWLAARTVDAAAVNEQGADCG
jgi:excisionase family DNA binding protein